MRAANQIRRENSLRSSGRLSPTSSTSSTSGNNFTVSFSSRSVALKRQAMNAVSRLGGGKGAKEEITSRVLIQVPPSARTDIRDMRSQYVQVATYNKNKLALAHRADYDKTVRLQSEEKHYLKILVCTALAFQKAKGGNCEFARTIAEVSEKSVANENNSNFHQQKSSSSGNDAPATSVKPISEEQATDLNFVGRVLCTDIDEMYASSGYSGLLTSLASLKIWKLE